MRWPDNFLLYHLVSISETMPSKLRDSDEDEMMGLFALKCLFNGSHVDGHVTGLTKFPLPV
jgi:hypothetical protein